MMRGGVPGRGRAVPATTMTGRPENGSLSVQPVSTRAERDACAPPSVSLSVQAVSFTAPRPHRRWTMRRNT